MLQWHDYHARLVKILDSMAPCSFWTRQPKQILCEVPFRYQHPQWPEVTFQGQIDALVCYEQANGQTEWWVLDFKQYGSMAFSGKPDIQHQKIGRVLTPYDEQASLQKKQERLYQLPIYFWATQYDELLRKRLQLDASQVDLGVTQVGILIFRETLPEDSSEYLLLLPVQAIQDQHEGLVDEFSTHILPFLAPSNTDYPATPTEVTCGRCPYISVCDDAQRFSFLDGDDDDEQGSETSS